MMFLCYSLKKKYWVRYMVSFKIFKNISIEHRNYLFLFRKFKLWKNTLATTTPTPNHTPSINWKCRDIINWKCWNIYKNLSVVYTFVVLLGINCWNKLRLSVCQSREFISWISTTGLIFIHMPGTFHSGELPV